jgi:adenylate kinase
MMIGITGTPGTGKSSLAEELRRRGHRVISCITTLEPYILERDEERDTYVVDEERWAEEFIPVEGFAEGHLAHYLPCDFIIVLRCRPDVLEMRLRTRGYSEAKIRENVEAEALDLILQETVGRFPPQRIHEIDTTFLTIEETSEIVERVFQGKMIASFGAIDWSGYL